MKFAFTVSRSTFLETTLITLPFDFLREGSHQFSIYYSMTPTEEEFEILWGIQKAVLSDLFNNRVEPKTAAQKLAAIVLPQPPPDQDDENDDDDTMAYIEGMWSLIIDKLEDDPRRAKTVSDLIVCVSQLPPAITQTGKQLCEDNRRVWQDVPRLGMALRDEWSGKSSCLALSHYEIDR